MRWKRVFILALCASLLLGMLIAGADELGDDRARRQVATEVVGLLLTAGTDRETAELEPLMTKEGFGRLQADKQPERLAGICEEMGCSTSPASISLSSMRATRDGRCQYEIQAEMVFSGADGETIQAVPVSGTVTLVPVDGEWRVDRITLQAQMLYVA